MSNYSHDRKWQDFYASQVMDILKPLTPYCVELAVAPAEEDNKHATDFEIKLMGGSIAVRLRRPDCVYRDLTIRAKRDTGVKTELAKIREGHAFRYFYGWTDTRHIVAEWMLVDLDKVRTAGLLEKKRSFIPNGDGTHFIQISMRELEITGCLIKQNVKRFIPMPPRQVNLNASLAEGIERARKMKSYLPHIEQSPLFGGDYA